MAALTAEQLEKLKGYYDSLLGQADILAGHRGLSVHSAECEVLFNEIERIKSDFPELLPPLDLKKIYWSSDEYYVAAIRGYVAACVARIKALLERGKSIAPVGETLEFTFIKDSSLRPILERDCVEIQKAYVSECWKSVVILTGGSLEAVLLDRLLQIETQAKAAKSAPSSKDVSKWDLSDLIKVAVELKVVEPSAKVLADAVRQYRNLVHPGNELRSKLSVGKLEANSGLNALTIVHRDLSR